GARGGGGGEGGGGGGFPDAGSGVVGRAGGNSPAVPGRLGVRRRDPAIPGSPGDQVSDDRDRAWGNGGSGDLVSGPPWRAGKQRRYSRAGRRGGDGGPGRDGGRPRRNRGLWGAPAVAPPERAG